jgi:hypothetical protein
LFSVIIAPAVLLFERVLLRHQLIVAVSVPTGESREWARRRPGTGEIAALHRSTLGHIFHHQCIVRWLVIAQVSFYPSRKKPGTRRIE